MPLRLQRRQAIACGQVLVVLFAWNPQEPFTYHGISRIGQLLIPRLCFQARLRGILENPSGSGSRSKAVGEISRCGPGQILRVLYLHYIQKTTPLHWVKPNPVAMAVGV